MIVLSPTSLLAIPVPDMSEGYVVDNAMQYMIFKVPNMKNWVTDKTLANPIKLQKWLDKTDKKGDPDYINTGVKLPDGKWEILGTVANTKYSFDQNPFIEDVNYSFDLLLAKNGISLDNKTLILKPLAH